MVFCVCALAPSNAVSILTVLCLYSWLSSARESKVLHEFLWPYLSPDTNALFYMFFCLKNKSINMDRKINEKNGGTEGWETRDKLLNAKALLQTVTHPPFLAVHPFLLLHILYNLELYIKNIYSVYRKRKDQHRK